MRFLILVKIISMMHQSKTLTTDTLKQAYKKKKVDAAVAAGANPDTVNPKSPSKLTLDRMLTCSKMCKSRCKNCY